MPENEALLTEPTLENIYTAFSGSGKNKIIAELMLCIRSRLTEITDFDPISAKALPADTASIINKIISLGDKEASYHKDRVFRIIDHTRASIKHIIKNTHSRIIRDHEIIPVYAVREMDSASIQWLARKSGRTLKEKLSGKPYLKAVIRKNSSDTAENRLFKAYLQKLDEILTIRKNCFKKDEDEIDDIQLSIQRFMRSDVFQFIGPWINISPNNILLQDKNYRKIWDGWNLLQSLSDDLGSDYKRMQQDFFSVLFWEILTQMRFYRAFRLLQIPVYIDYNEYSFYGIEKKEGSIFSVKGFLLAEKNAKDSHNNQNYGEFDMYLKIDGEKPCLKIVFVSSGSTIYLNYIEQGIRIIYNEKKFKIVPANSFSQIKNISSKIITHILGENYQKDIINHKEPELMAEKIENAAIDLYNVKPEFITEKYKNEQIPEALLLQYWEKGTVVDCGKATAIKFGEGIKTISLRNLFSNDKDFSKVEKNNAAMELSRKIKEFLNVNILSYLVPDWADEFDLENIRRGINFHFEEAYSVPQSIAAIIYYFDAIKKIPRIYNEIFKDEKTIFLVIDSNANNLTITPVSSNKRNDLKEKVQETNGIFWERHPTITKKIPNQINEDIFVSNLYKTLGKEFILNKENAFSIYEDSRWHHLPENTDTFINKKERIILSSNKIKEIKDEIFKNEKFDQKKPVKILVLDNNISCGDEKYDFVPIGSLLKGTMTLYERQKKAENIPLWKDHLPELFIKNNTGITYILVGKDTPPITPERGKKIPIQVSGTVELPKGAKDIRFQLIQGKGSIISKYTAYLESPMFPLNEDTTCDLSLTYTYGDKKPYTLQFKPKNPATAGFKMIEVQWLTKDELPELEYQTPLFPEPKTWEDFRRWPNKDGTGTYDLIEWCVKGLKSLGINRLNPEKSVKSILFAASTIWNNGHSLSEIDAPNELREKFQQSSGIMIDMLKKQETSSKLKRDVILFFSCIHKDMPYEVAAKIIQFTNNSWNEYQLYKTHPKEIAYAIGDASLPWQSTLLKTVLNPKIRDKLMSTSLIILSIALWRNEKLIYKIDDNKAKVLVNELKKYFIENIKDGIKELRNCIILARHLELLLALLRKRNTKNKILYPESEDAEWFLDKIRNIPQILKEFLFKKPDNKFHSYLEFEVENQEKDDGVPDIIFALRKYLAGEVYTIKISGIDFEEE